MRRLQGDVRRERHDDRRLRVDTIILADLEARQRFHTEEEVRVLGEHVRCANEFLHEILAKEPRLALKVGTALKDATRQFLEVFGSDATAVTKYTISEQGRLEAGFRPDEVELSNRLAEQRRERAPT